MARQSKTTGRITTTVVTPMTNSGGAMMTLIANPIANRIAISANT